MTTSADASAQFANDVHATCLQVNQAIWRIWQSDPQAAQAPLRFVRVQQPQLDALALTAYQITAAGPLGELFPKNQFLLLNNDMVDRLVRTVFASRRDLLESFAEALEGEEPENDENGNQT